jgi:hypothetical protein
MRVLVYPGFDSRFDHVSYASFVQTGTSLPLRSCTLLRTADGKAERVSVDAWRPAGRRPVDASANTIHIYSTGRRRKQDTFLQPIGGRQTIATGPVVGLLLEHPLAQTSGVDTKIMRNVTCRSVLFPSKTHGSFTELGRIPNAHPGATAGIEGVPAELSPAA